MAEAAPKKPAQASESVRMAILCAVGTMLANGIFFVLSYAYYKAHATNAAVGAGIGDVYVMDVKAMANAREAFLVLTLIGGALAYVATRVPREFGHGLALLLGLANLAAAYGAFDKSLPMVMPVTLLVAGLVMPVLVYLSWQKSRSAWAFLIALVAVFGGIGFFGAPKVRQLVGIGLWTAMIMPMLTIETVIALAVIRRDYAR